MGPLQWHVCTCCSACPCAQVLAYLEQHQPEEEDEADGDQEDEEEEEEEPKCVASSGTVAGCT